MRLRSGLPFATAILIFSLGFANVASADPGPIKQAYIASAKHFAGIEPGETDLDATFGDGIEITTSQTADPLSPSLTRGPASNVQVNDPSLDHRQTFSGTRPFEFATQSETSIARSGRDVVVGYNSSAGAHVVQTASGLFFDRVQLSGYSHSSDGGSTWQSGFVPGVPGFSFGGTFGDPSVGVDRAGNFYYASLGDDASFKAVLIVNKSTDGGATFGSAKVIATDSGSDKEWLAVGRDPNIGGQDNVYVAWTSFQSASSQLRFTRSTDGGATWSAQRILFAPTDDGVMSSFIQFANPVVDRENGRLYIPFLHFSDSDADMVRVLVSDNAGDTFSFLRFDQPGAPDPFAFPNVTPGTISDCGRPGGGIRLVLHQGANLGGGRFGLPRYRQSTRLISQPSAAVNGGHVVIAINSSTSPSFGDPTSGSSIRLLSSLDAGVSWTVSTVAASSAADPQHVHPAVLLDDDGSLTVTYYVQQADGKLRVDASKAVLGTLPFAFAATPASNVSFDLPPSNNPIPTATQPFRTTNWDRTIVACYAIGEYLSITSGGESAWGDSRNSWTSPEGAPVVGPHPQEDVFFGRLGN